MATNFTSLFTPPEDILAAQQQQNLARQAAISQQGSQFGVFAPLYQAGLRNIDTAAQALMPTQDPRLQRASMIQSVISNYADKDTTDPDVLANMSRDFASIGATREAMMLAQDARAARKDVSAEKRLQGAEERAQAAERRAAYTFNPELAIQDASKLAEDDPRRAELLSAAAKLMEKDNFDKAAKLAKIDSDTADAIYKRAAANRANKEATLGTKQWEKAGVDVLGNVVLYNPYTAETKTVKGVLSESVGQPAKGAGEPTKPKRGLDEIAKGSNQGIPETQRRSGLAGVLDENERLNPRARTAPSNSTWEMPF